MRPFDLGRRYRDPVPFLEHLVGGRRLAIDADQEVGRLAADLLLKQRADGRAGGNFEIYLWKVSWNVKSARRRARHGRRRAFKRGENVGTSQASPSSLRRARAAASVG